MGLRVIIGTLMTLIEWICADLLKLKLFSWSGCCFWILIWEWVLSLGGCWVGVALEPLPHSPP
jgi:hypothetical protein